MKLKDYSDEEKQAVFREFFGGSNVQYDDLTETQLEDIMKSFNGSRIIAFMLPSFRVGRHKRQRYCRSRSAMRAKF